MVYNNCYSCVCTQDKFSEQSEITSTECNIDDGDFANEPTDDSALETSTNAYEASQTPPVSVEVDTDLEDVESHTCQQVCQCLTHRFFYWGILSYLIVIYLVKINLVN